MWPPTGPAPGGAPPGPACGAVVFELVRPDCAAYYRQLGGCPWPPGTTPWGRRVRHRADPQRSVHPQAHRRQIVLSRLTRWRTAVAGQPAHRPFGRALPSHPCYCGFMASPAGRGRIVGAVIGWLTHCQANGHFEFRRAIVRGVRLIRHRIDAGTVIVRAGVRGRGELDGLVAASRSGEFHHGVRAHLRVGSRDRGVGGPVVAQGGGPCGPVGRRSAPSPTGPLLFYRGLHDHQVWRSSRCPPRTGR